jgi:hypothetical protein
LLATDFVMNSQKLPLREGRIHFMRRVQAEGTVRVLNVDWAVPDPDPSHGVWVTIHFRPAGRALLSIYDAAPDVADRKCLVSHAFPLKEAVLPREERLDETAIHLVTELSIPTSSLVQPEVAERQVLFPKPRPGIGQGLLNSAIYHTTRLTQRIWHTMY